MKHYIGLIFFLIFAISLKAQKLEKIASIELNEASFKNKYTVSLNSRTNKNLGKFAAVNPFELLKPYYSADSKSFIIQLETEKGEKFTFCSSDFNPEIQAIAPELLIGKSEILPADTIKVTDKDLSKSKQLESIAGGAIIKKITLQSLKFSDSEKAMLEKKFCLIFPTDKTNARLIAGIKRFIIFKIIES